MPEIVSVSRGQHTVHVVPADWDAAPGPLARVLDRAAAEAEEVQAVVLVADADAAVGVADALVRARGRVPPRIVAATGAARAARVLRAGTAPIIVGAPAQIVALVRAAALKLGEVRAVGVAWADEILATGGGADLEAIMAEVPKDAPRTILAAELNPAVEDFIERYARRASRFGATSAPAKAPEGGTGASLAPAPGAPPAPAPAIPLGYVLVTPAARANVLRRLLDEIDPPSAAISVRSDESERAVREALLLLGYHGDNGALRVVRGPIADHSALLVLFDLPHDSAELAQTVAGVPGKTIAMLLPRQLPYLIALTTGPVRPFVFAGPAEGARGRDETMRAELRREIAAGSLDREVLALEPLLAETDGVAVAAAALRLLERHRQSAAATAAAIPANRPVAQAEPASRPPADTGRPSGRPDGQGYGRPRSGGPRGGNPERGGRGGPPSRGGPPGRGGPGSGDRDRGRNHGRDRGDSGGRERGPGRPDTRPLPRSPR